MARDQILIVDDEPYYLTWLEEFLIELGYNVVFCETANEAAVVAANQPFRAIVFDLNIPISGALRESAMSKGGLYVTYPGLYLASVARTGGYRDRQIIVYSVHSLEEIATECKKLSCTYISKGRPPIFKKELQGVLSYDPTKDKKRSSRERTSRPAQRKGAPSSKKV